MSVTVGRTWRDAQAVRNGERVPGRWLVTVFFRWDSGEPLRERTVVGESTAIPCRSAGQAKTWGAKRERELFKAGPPNPEAEAVISKVDTIETFGPVFIKNHAKANLHKASGVDTQESILKLHVYPFVGGLRLDQITDEVVADLKAKWIAGAHTYIDQFGRERAVRATSSPKTLNNRLSVLSSMLEKAYDWKRIAVLPCRIRMLKVDADAEAGHLEHDVYERLVAASAKLDPRIHVAILLGGDGGLRRGEILALNLSDVDFKNARFHVRRNVYWRKGVAIVDSTKGGKAKPVPATPRLLAALKACRHLRGERVLYSDDGDPVTPKLIKMWVQRAEKAAGLEQTGRLHVMRHTFCSHLAMAGVPARTVQALARHASLSITMRYMHLSPQAADEGIAMLTESRESGGSPVLRKERTHR